MRGEVQVGGGISSSDGSAGISEIHMTKWRMNHQLQWKRNKTQSFVFSMLDVCTIVKSYLSPKSKYAKVYEKRADPRVDCASIESALWLVTTISVGEIPSLFLFLRAHLLHLFLFFNIRISLFFKLVQGLGWDYSRWRRLNRLAAAHLPFHEFGEGAIWTST